MSRGPGKWQRHLLEVLARSHRPMEVTNPKRYTTAEQVAMRRAAYTLAEQGRIQLAALRIGGRDRLVAYRPDADLPDGQVLTVGTDGKRYRRTDGSAGARGTMPVQMRRVNDKRPLVAAHEAGHAWGAWLSGDGIGDEVCLTENGQAGHTQILRWSAFACIAGPIAEALWRLHRDGHGDPQTVPPHVREHYVTQSLHQNGGDAVADYSRLRALEIKGPDALTIGLNVMWEMGHWWASITRLASALDDTGHLTGAQAVALLDGSSKP